MRIWNLFHQNRVKFNIYLKVGKTSFFLRFISKTNSTAWKSRKTKNMNTNRRLSLESSLLRKL